MATTEQPMPLAVWVAVLRMLPTQSTLHLKRSLLNSVIEEVERQA